MACRRTTDTNRPTASTTFWNATSSGDLRPPLTDECRVCVALLPLFKPQIANDALCARRQLPELVGHHELFRRGGLFHLPLEFVDLFAPLSAAFDFLLAIANST